MSSIYKNGKYYYLSVNVQGKRKTKSLGTTSHKKAQHLKPQIESNLLHELLGKKSVCQNLTFTELKIGSYNSIIIGQSLLTTLINIF